MDASLLPSTRASIEVVIRNDKGQSILAMGKQIEHWDVTTMELLKELSFIIIFNVAQRRGREEVWPAAKVDGGALGATSPYAKRTLFKYYLKILVIHEIS
ncbi:hypothetical protein IEQ34_020907 [Dendrobium chrysotoxum]|uniref:Uncharacterized protein n=1 Tax=Dendrobium chrysotoxum TaxID=161865 RepID=A0AAV7G388_DENCH|nr:hypothetical protein IEQ34_020907 [Dendrobium chrysotoxum]